MSKNEDPEPFENLPGMAVQVRNVTFAWPGASTNVIDIPDFSIRQGERIFLLGASGSGKSTFLNLVAGLMNPGSGHVQVLGQNISALGNRARDRFRARHIGFIFQEFNLIPYLDVQSNITLAAQIAGTDGKLVRDRMEELLDALRISRPVPGQRADQLSVGQQQRVAVARAMINQPELIVADEPTSALDDAVRDEFIRLLLSIQERTSATILFVSHDRSLVRHFDRVAAMSDINRVATTEGSTC